MKVVYLSLLPAPGEAAVSGVPKVSETLLRQFESMPELDVHAITLIDGLATETGIKRGSVAYHYLCCKPRWKTATLYRAETKRLAALVEDSGADLVHGQPTGEYLLAATGAKIPGVITVHGLIMREAAGLSAFTEEFFANAVREFLQRRSVRRAKNVISISPYVDAYLRGRTAARVWPVPNPIDEEFFGLEPPAAGALRILCVGIVSDRKNQGLLVEACRLLTVKKVDFECRIVGRQQPLYGAFLEGQISGAGLNRQVTLTGILSKAELLECYRWANVVVLPSREETSPLSLIQGMAAGRCVFGASAAGIPALLENGRYGELFSPDSPESLAGGLHRLSADPAHFRERAALASAHAAECFRPSAVAGKTLEVYRGILEARA